IYDLVALRLVVGTVSECYAALGIIHEKWPPLPGRIKDYIAMPKPNSYRSIHTTVIGPNEKIIELQIRTMEMHEENEHGVAAHWIYQQVRNGKEKSSSKKLTEDIKWVQQLKNWQKKYFGDKTDPDEFINSMKIDFFKDRIFVITPKGDVIDLPDEATPVDFAYQIHSEIGNSCVGAKINGQMAPLNHKLHSGDLVEILIQKNKKPVEDWLEFAKTSIARSHIKAALRAKTGTMRNIKPVKSEIKIVAEERMGLIKDFSTIIARSHINITNFYTQNTQSGRFTISRIECATTDKNRVEKTMTKIKKLKGVRDVSYRLLSS
ncbi:MAG: TGS domain-containing protein, partial [Patescibacteria group bacterium]